MKELPTILVTLIELDKINEFNQIVIQGKYPSKRSRRLIVNIIKNQKDENEVIKIFKSLSVQENLDNKNVLISWFIDAIIESNSKISDSSLFVSYLIINNFFSQLYRLSKFLNIEESNIKDYHKIFNFIKQFAYDTQKISISKSDINKLNGIISLLIIHKKVIPSELLKKLLLKLIETKIRSRFFDGDENLFCFYFWIWIFEPGFLKNVQF